MKKKAIWVLENIDQSSRYYSTLNILILMSSIINWKKHHDTFNELYVDVMTFRFLEDLGVLGYWDRVDAAVLCEDHEINKFAFWSSSKLRVLAKQEEPVIMVDYDFIAYTNVVGIDPDSSVIYSYDECGDSAYPTATDKYVRQLVDIPPYLKWCKNRDAINVSLLEFNNQSFQKEYADQSLAIMKEFTKVHAPKGIYVCYAEQLVLKQMLLEYELKHTSLISNIYDAVKSEFFYDRFNGNGLWSYEKSKLKFYHIGVDKPKIRQGDQIFNHLLKSINASIPVTTLNKILKLSGSLVV